jgi:hypothetical protein
MHIFLRPTIVLKLVGFDIALAPLLSIITAWWHLSLQKYAQPALKVQV